MTKQLLSNSMIVTLFEIDKWTNEELVIHIPNEIFELMLPLKNNSFMGQFKDKNNQYTIEFQKLS